MRDSIESARIAESPQWRLMVKNGLLRMMQLYSWIENKINTIIVKRNARKHK